MKIYCDGACQPNPGHMGIGIYIPESEACISKYLGMGTNQIAELLAIREAIKLANHVNPGDAILSDSQYAIKIALTQWKAKMHLELVTEIRTLLKSKRVSLEWVRGHNGDFGQEISDALATVAVSQNGRYIDQRPSRDRALCAIVETNF